MAQKNTRMPDRCYEVQYLHNRKSASDENGGRKSTSSRYTSEDNGLGILEVVTKSCSAPTTIRVKSRRYDIPTLLEIGRQVEARGYEPVHRRLISVTSRKSNASNRVLRERSINHSRNSTCGTIDTEDNHQTLSVQCPQRQPRNAPQGLLAQTNEGFARFLKDHASPKHQRVTAGGRIVPMNPLPPSAPEFVIPRDLDATNSPNMDGPVPETDVFEATSKEEKPDTGGRHKARKSRGTAESRAAHSKRFTSGTVKTPNATAPAPVVVSQYRTPVISGPPATSVAPNQLGIQFASGFNNRQTTSAGFPSSEEFTMPIGMASPNRGDQCELIQPNFQQYYFPQMTPIVPDVLNPSSSIQYASQVGNVGVYANPPLALGNPMQYYQIPGSMNHAYYYNPVTPNIEEPQPATVTPNDHSSYNVYENAVQEFENLSSQLTNLDRYLALHSWDIDATSKKVLVAQRVELVTKLDAARVLKENLESVLKPYLSGEIHGNGTSIQNTQPAIEGAQSSPYIIQPALDDGYGQTVMPGTHQRQSPTSTEATSFGSPLQTNRIPHRPTESFHTDYQDLHVKARPRESHGSNNWTLSKQSTAATGDGDSVRIITEASGETVAEPSGEWVPPPEINTIYRKIEQAAQRNEALGPLFRELAKATALLNAPLTRKLQETADYSDKHRLNSSRGGSQAFSAVANDADDAPCPGIWQHQAPGRVPQVPPRNSIDRSKRHIDNVETPSNSSDKNQTFGHIPAETASKAANMQNPGYMSQCSSLARIQPMQKRQSNAAQKPQSGGLYEASSVLDKSTNGARTTPQHRQHSALSFTTCGRSTRSRSAQKVETLASAQKINAQGILPSYDGSGEGSANPSTQPGRSNDNDNARNKNNADTGQPSPGQGFSKGPRQTPNTMDVRAFFQMLRDEDRETLKKYRGEKRMLG